MEADKHLERVRHRTNTKYHVGLQEKATKPNRYVLPPFGWMAWKRPKHGIPSVSKPTCDERDRGPVDLVILLGGMGLRVHSTSLRHYCYVVWRLWKEGA